MADKVEAHSISQRIRKLLALAEGNQNEHERDSAMKLAMELLSRHNLDINIVVDASREIGITEVEMILKLDPWIRSVLHAACKLYYTRFYMRSVYRGYFCDRKENHPTFIGTEENINVTIEVAGWLLNSIRAEGNCLFKEPYERRSFRLGAAHKLYDRACKLVEEESRNCAQSSSNSLMVLRNDLEKANERYMARLNCSTFYGRGSYYDDDAYGQGETFGESVNLGKSSKPKAITMR